jgi:hypothetical protein
LFTVRRGSRKNSSKTSCNFVKISFVFRKHYWPNDSNESVKQDNVHGNWWLMLPRDCMGSW